MPSSTLAPFTRSAGRNCRAPVLLAVSTAVLVCSALATTAAAQAANRVLPELVLLGDPSLHLGLAAKTIQDSGEFRVRVNADVDSADLVLVVIHGPDGPMPQVLDEIRRRNGQTLARVAILITDADLPDSDLLALVVLESREVLGRLLGEELTNRVEVLKMPDPDLISKLKALLFLPPVNIRVRAGTPGGPPSVLDSALPTTTRVKSRARRGA
jgi:hypothetical protein